MCRQIYPGTQAQDMDLAGMTPAEREAVPRRHLTMLQAQAVVAGFEVQAWQASRSGV
jgi:hypothetical protein